MKLNHILLLIVFVLFSCNEEKTNHTVRKSNKNINKFSDKTIRKIYTLLDRRKKDSLAFFLQDKDAKYRAEAANAFATVQDTLYLDILHAMLQDKDSLVQEKAAWAIGQSRDHSSFEVLKNTLPIVSSNTKTNLLEAQGKCANTSDFIFYDKFEVTPDNSLGFSKSIYQLSYRYSLPSFLLVKVIKLLSTVDDENAKKYLARAISRGKSEDLAKLETYIFQLINAAPNSEVLLSLYAALGKIQSATTSDFLVKKIIGFGNNIPDYRVIVSALNAYSRQKNTAWKIFGSYLGHANENIGLAASNCLINSNYHPKYNSKIKNHEEQYSPRIEAKVLQYSYEYKKDQRWLQSILYKYRNATNYLNKSFYLRALTSDKNQALFIEGAMINEGHPIIKTAAAESLVEMMESDNIPKNMNFIKTIKAGFKTNDVGVIATFARHLANATMDYKDELKTHNFIDDALVQLVLPKDIETYNEILKAKAYLTDSIFELKQINSNNSLDWNSIIAIPKDQKAVVLTNKGKIEITLDVENAPGSVSNFIQLAREGFFDNKVFHRIVPNFVVQTGCPRGDGYGSINRTIRSEFSLHNYSTGAVGMASAGKDTESCQWFITHSPTPFLEGRYTIFGYIDDLDLLTLHQLKMGDKIVSVTIE